MTDFAECTGCGVVIHCDGENHRGDLAQALRQLADDYERGAMFRTGAGVATRLRALLASFERPREDAPPPAPPPKETP